MATYYSAVRRNKGTENSEINYSLTLMHGDILLRGERGEGGEGKFMEGGEGERESRRLASHAILAAGSTFVKPFFIGTNPRCINNRPPSILICASSR